MKGMSNVWVHGPGVTVGKLALMTLAPAMLGTDLS